MGILSNPLLFKGIADALSGSIGKYNKLEESQQGRELALLKALKTAQETKNLPTPEEAQNSRLLKDFSALLKNQKQVQELRNIPTPEETQMSTFRKEFNDSVSDMLLGKPVVAPSNLDPSLYGKWNKTVDIGQQYGRWLDANKRQAELRQKTAISNIPMGEKDMADTIRQNFTAITNAQNKRKPGFEVPKTVTVKKGNEIITTVFDPVTGRSKTYTSPRFKPESKGGKQKTALDVKIKERRLEQLSKAIEATEKNSRLQREKFDFQKTQALTKKGLTRPQLLRKKGAASERQVALIKAKASLNSTNMLEEKYKKTFGKNVPVTLFVNNKQLDPEAVAAANELIDKTMAIIQEEIDSYDELLGGTSPQALEYGKRTLNENNPEDRQIMDKILEEAGNDPNKALELAEQKGYTF